jgi:hypothetical protein
LILAGATREDGNDFYVAWFHTLLASRRYADFDLVYWRYDTYHEGVIPLALQDALMLLYPSANSDARNNR